MMTEHEIIGAIRRICEEAFDPEKEVSDLHRAQALAIIYNAIITNGDSLPQEHLPKDQTDQTDQITFDDIMQETK